jgi:hypothetical protein
MPVERAPDTRWIGGWVGLRTGLDDVERRKSWPCRDSNTELLAVQPVGSRYTDCTISAVCTVINKEGSRIPDQQLIFLLVFNCFYLENFSSSLRKWEVYLTICELLFCSSSWKFYVLIPKLLTINLIAVILLLGRRVPAPLRHFQCFPMYLPCTHPTNV